MELSTDCAIVRCVCVVCGGAEPTHVLAYVHSSTSHQCFVDIDTPSTLTGRPPATAGDDFTVTNSEFADDTALPFTSVAKPGGFGSVSAFRSVLGETDA
eukprot:7390430-Prymnesium_polylepis.1